MIRQRPSADHAEAGFTLIELVVASALTIVVLTVLGTLFTSAARTESTVSSATAAANLGQLIARSITQGVSNATAVTVTTDSSGDQMLQARVYGMSAANDPTQAASSGVSCQAWYYTASGGGAIYTKTVTPASAITMPSGAVDSTWQLIGNGLGVNVATSPSATIFATPSGTRVELKFDVTSGTLSPVHIETTVHIPNTTTVSAPCF
jgi:Tfp pilus assembly protein FimT